MELSGSRCYADGEKVLKLFVVAADAAWEGIKWEVVEGEVIEGAAIDSALEITPASPCIGAIVVIDDLHHGKQPKELKNKIYRYQKLGASAAVIIIG